MRCVFLSLLGCVLLAVLAVPCEAMRVLSLVEGAPAEWANGGLEPDALREITFTASVRFDDPAEEGVGIVEVLCWRVVDAPVEGELPIDPDSIPEPERISVDSNQPYESIDGKLVSRQTAEATEFSFSIPIDHLKLEPGFHRLMFVARATDLTGRVSQAAAPPIMLSVERSAVVTGQRTETRTVQKLVAESRTRTVTTTAPNGMPMAREQVFTVMVPVAEEREVTAAEIEPGSYARAYGAVYSAPSEIDPSDENIAAELARIELKHGVERERTKTVYYATNRELIDPDENGTGRFGNDLGGQMHYGSALVHIPPTHFYGDEIDTPWFTYFHDPQKHFKVETVSGFTEDNFFQLMQTRLAGSQREGHRTENDVLLYVHGFATSMKFSLLRLAQVSYDVGFEGLPLAFVWPSNGSKLRYASDLSDAEESIDELAALIVRMCKPQHGGRVHIIAHSMGNFVTLQALREVESQWSELPADERPQLGHVVLAAPDVWTEEFNAWAPSAIRSAMSVTHYHCADDLPLKLSVAFHRVKPRAGLASILLSGLDNINCDETNTTFFGHSAYADESPLLFDLQLLLQRDADPSGRPLEFIDEPMQGSTRWKSRPSLSPTIEAPVPVP